jgi:hypothetical protein
MGKQYNKIIKRRRRNAYLVRKKTAADTKEKSRSKARPAKPAVEAAPPA